MGQFIRGVAKGGVKDPALARTPLEHHGHDDARGHRVMLACEFTPSEQVDRGVVEDEVSLGLSVEIPMPCRIGSSGLVTWTR